MQHEHEVIGGDIAGGVGSERAAADAADTGIDDLDAGVDGGERVGNPGVAGVVEVNPERDVAGHGSDRLDPEPDRPRVGHPDRVGDGYLGTPGLGQSPGER